MNARCQQLILVLVSLWLCEASGKFLSSEVTKFDMDSAFKARDAGFIYPNERRPYDAIPILAQAEGNVYLSVGTERSLWGFGFATHQTHLVMADNHPRVVLYNLINLALLKSVKTRFEYFDLRNTKNLSDWEKAVHQGAQDLAPFANAKFFEFWRDKQELFEHLYPHMFGDGNYLFDDAAFERISKAAHEGRIEVVLASYGDSATFEKLIQELKEKNLSLGVLDFSNAWWGHPPLVKKMLNSCSKIALPKSIYMVTSGEEGMWLYKGMFFGSLAMKFHNWLSPLRKMTLAEYFGPFSMVYGQCEPLLNPPSRWHLPWR